jgi:hypothetical protein
LSPRTTRGLVYLALLLFYLAHNDLWLWDDARIVLGLPVGLTYHVAYCIVAALLMAVLVRVARDGRPAMEHRPEDRS